MGSPSKEERILELFLNEPSKHWHFSNILEISKVSEGAASKWLRKLRKENIIIHVKPRDKMPFFQANFRHMNYKNKKRIYALTKLYESGFLHRLQNLEKAKTVVIFGSFSRSDWYSKSDIDVFVYGDPEDLKYGTFWESLGFQGKTREVQVHSFSSIEKIREISSGLMKNVVDGIFVKGSIHDFAEVKI